MRHRLGADSPGACGLGKAPLPGTGSVLQPCGPWKPEIIGCVTERGGGSSSCPHGLTGICHPRGAALSSYSSLFEPSSYLSSLRATPSFSGSGQSLGSILDSFLAPTSNLSAKSLGSTMKIDSDFNHFSLLRQDGPRHCHFSPVSLHKLINWSPCLCPFCISASPHSLSTQ